MRAAYSRTLRVGWLGAVDDFRPWLIRAAVRLELGDCERMETGVTVTTDMMSTCAQAPQHFLNFSPLAHGHSSLL